jgi:predicted kinase
VNIDDELLLAVNALYRPSIKNSKVAHPKLLILFSGPPSSGKSTVAKAIEKHFRAIRLENDSIRVLANKLQPTSDLNWKSELSYAYMDYLRPRLAKDSPNGLWIIDANIDVHHKKLFDFAKQYGFNTVLLAMTIPEKLRREWILETGDRPWAKADKYLETMAMRKAQHDKFLATHMADMYLKPGYRIKDVFELIDSRLRSLS